VIEVTLNGREGGHIASIRVHRRPGW
jgi:hypothetical protein